MAGRNLADHARDLVRVERRERDHAVVRARLPGRAEFGPRRRDDQQRRLRTALCEPLQHVERGRIGPVQVLEGEHDRLGASAGQDPGNQRRELAAAQFLGRKFRNASRRQRRVDHRREQRRIFGGVEPDGAERRFEFGEALFAGDFGAAEADAAPFRDRVQRRVLQQLRGRPLDPGVRRLRQPRAKLLDQPDLPRPGSPTISVSCPSPRRARSQRRARMSSSSVRPTSGVSAREPPRRPPPLARTMR